MVLHYFLKPSAKAPVPFSPFGASWLLRAKPEWREAKQGLFLCLPVNVGEENGTARCYGGENALVLGENAETLDLWVLIYEMFL